MPPIPHQPKNPPMLELAEVRALLIIFWRQGIKRNTRWQFWKQLFLILRKNPSLFSYYLTNCAHLEHFLEYRQIIWNEVEAELAAYASRQSQDTPLAVSSSI
jgi:hypothetical protein